MKRDNQKEVSIIVVSFNSEEWILETLNSIKKQTFKKIELIISDDCSNDNTVSICKEWINNNKERFTNIKLICSSENLGIVKNINKGVKESKNIWLKIIAADDVLKNDCIEKNMEYIYLNKNVNILFSKIQAFKEILNKENYLGNDLNTEEGFILKNSKYQFKKLVKKNRISAPSYFINKNLLEQMNYFDETYRNVEDYPMWLKLTWMGIKLDYLDEVTVYYRVHKKSISNCIDKIINEQMFEFRKKIYYGFIKDKVNNIFFHYSERLIHMKYENIIRNGNKKKTIIYYILTLLDPYTYINRLRNLRRRYEKI